MQIFWISFVCIFFGRKKRVMTIAITEYGRIREFASCGAVIVRKVGEYFFCPTNWEMQHIERPWTTVLEDELQRRCLFEPRTFNRQIFFCATYIGGFFLQCSFLFVVPLGQTKNVLRLNKVIWKFQFFIKCQKTFSLKVNCAWSGPWSDRLLSHFKKRAIIFIVARWVIKWGPKIVIRYLYFSDQGGSI